MEEDRQRIAGALRGLADALDPPDKPSSDWIDKEPVWSVCLQCGGPLPEVGDCLKCGAPQLSEKTGSFSDSDNALNPVTGVHSGPSKPRHSVQPCETLGYDPVPKGVLRSGGPTI